MQNPQMFSEEKPYRDEVKRDFKQLDYAVIANQWHWLVSFVMRAFSIFIFSFN